MFGSKINKNFGTMSLDVAKLANLRYTADTRSRVHSGAYSAFRAGAAIGYMISTLGMLSVSVVYLVLEDVRVLAGIAADAASVALMCRVVGSIYNSATSIGSCLLNLIQEEAGVCLDVLETCVRSMVITAPLGSILT